MAGIRSALSVLDSYFTRARIGEIGSFFHRKPPPMEVSVCKWPIIKSDLVIPKLPSHINAFQMGEPEQRGGCGNLILLPFFP